MHERRAGPTLVYDRSSTHSFFHTPQQQRTASFQAQPLPQVSPSPFDTAAQRRLSARIPEMAAQRQHYTRASTPPSPTLSTLSSLSSAAPESPSDDQSLPFTSSRTVTVVKKGKEKAVAPPKKIKKERQTRISDHLPIVKPGSTSSSTSSSSKAKGFSIVAPLLKSASPKRTAPKRDSPVVPVVVSSAPISTEEPPVTRSSTRNVAVKDRETEGASESIAPKGEVPKDSELIGRLAEHGIYPEKDLLHRVLAQGVTGKDWTVQSFLLALSAIEAESSSTPSESCAHSAETSPTSLQAASSGLPLRATSPTPSRPSCLRSAHLATKVRPAVTFVTPPPFCALDNSFPAVPGTPAVQRNGRLQAFEGRRSSSALVAAEITGLGRVALVREKLVERLGPTTAEEAIAAARLPSRPIAFGEATPTLAAPAELEAFGPSASGLADSERSPTQSPIFTERLDRVRSWLDSPEMTDEEGEAWSTIPKEWFDKYEDEQMLPSPVQPVEAKSVEESGIVEEIRVGGKSVRKLLRTKRLRGDEDVDGGATLTEGGSAGLNEAGALQDEHYCECDNTDQGGSAMVECGACRVWHRSSCFNLPTVQKLGDAFVCSRCKATQAIPLPKRSRYQAPSTPVFHTEPTFASSAPSSFYAAPDVVLAPSPLPPSSRPYVPRSPVLAPAPRTPQPSQSRDDYAPYSPQMHRATRNRMVSGAFEDIPSSYHGAGTSWESTSIASYGFDALPEDMYWQCSTPSRNLPSSAMGWSEGGLQTPQTGSRRHRIPSHGQPVPTSSQDFLSGLHHSREDSISHPYAQRLFSSPAPGSVPSSGSAAYYATPSTPSRGLRTHHRRNSSITNSLFPAFSGPEAPPSWTTPFPTPSRRFSNSRPISYQMQQSPAPQVSVASDPYAGKQLRQSVEAPDMARRGSGLGIGLHNSIDLDEPLFR